MNLSDIINLASQPDAINISSKEITKFLSDFDQLYFYTHNRYYSSQIKSQIEDSSEGTIILGLKAIKVGKTNISVSLNDLKNKLYLSISDKSHPCRLKSFIPIDQESAKTFQDCSQMMIKKAKTEFEFFMYNCFPCDYETKTSGSNFEIHISFNKNNRKLMIFGNKSFNGIVSCIIDGKGIAYDFETLNEFNARVSENVLCSEEIIYVKRIEKLFSRYELELKVSTTEKEKMELLSKIRL